MAQKIKFLICSMFFIVIANLGAQSAIDGIDKLIWITEEYEPYNFTKDGKVTGICVDVLKLIWTELGVGERPIQVLPWARGYQMLETQTGTVLFATARTQAREKLFKWVGPVASNRYVVLTRTSEAKQWSKIADIGTRRAAAVRKDVAEQLLLENGVKDSQITRVESIPAAIRMLESKRVDFVAYGEYSFNKAVSELGLSASDFTSVFVLQESPLYYAFHIATDDSIISRLQNALNAIKKRPEYQAILQRFR